MSKEARSSLFETQSTPSYSPVYNQNVQQANEVQLDYSEGQIQLRSSQLKSYTSNLKDMLSTFNEEVDTENKRLDDTRIDMTNASVSANKLRHDIRDKVEDNSIFGIARGQSRFKEMVPLASATARKDIQYRKCVNVTVLGESCIELYALEANLTIGVRLIIRDYVVLDQYITGSHLCLGQRELLILLEHIPALLPFKPIIDQVIKLEGFIPAKLFSICLNFTDLKFSKTLVTGCSNMESTLMCYKNKCLYKGDRDFGCFEIPL